jgi:diguanylate cyclase (GGDEF)-like protein
MNSITPGSSNKTNHRRTIGYMTNGVFGSGGRGGYHFSLWKGIQEAARAHDVNVVCFIGGSYRISPSYEYEYQRSNVFDLISSDHLDGLIVSSATLISTISSEELCRYSSHFGRQCVVSIGIQLANYPSLFVENYTGARQVVDHLIEVHGYRRIAYIQGPLENEDARIRCQAYLDSLQAHGILVDPDLILQGDFTRATGESGALRLLDEARLPVEALVAGNDNMALGAIASLRSRGLVVPGQLAVVGFDDIPDASLSFPALTTVRQPTYELGKRAVELLLGHLELDEMPSGDALPTSAVIRSSCGCSMQLAPSRPVDTEVGRGTHKGGPPDRKTLIKKMVDTLGCTPSQRRQAAQKAGELLDAILKVMEPGDPSDSHLKNLALLMNTAMEKDPLRPWHRAIAILMRSLWSENNSVKWQNIWQLSSEMAWFSQSFVRLEEQNHDEKQSELFRRISQALVTTFNLTDLMGTIWRLLPRLGIEGCWVFLYEQPGISSSTIRLKLAYNRAGKIDLPAEGLLYPVHWFLPEDMMNNDGSFEVFVNSLFYGDNNFGYVIFEMVEPDQKILDMITSQISTALQGTTVINQLQIMQAEFRRQANTDLLTGIYNRRMLYTLGEPAFELARRHKQALSVAMIDVDNFKRVNDGFGHAAGDEVLSALSSIISSQIRGGDIFGRFGGEEFLIILPETPGDGAALFVERVRKSIENHVFGGGKEAISLTISIGLATLVHQQDQTIDALIARADKALYQAKDAGKNRVAIID